MLEARTSPRRSLSFSTLLPILLRKEVIHPHLPVRIPCYDFTPITNPTFDGSLQTEVRIQMSDVRVFGEISFADFFPYSLTSYFWPLSSVRLSHRLRVLPTFVVWRAVCTRPGNAFTATCWSAITSDSDFMQSSCRLQSELRMAFWDSLHLAASLLSVPSIVARV